MRIDVHAHYNPPVLVEAFGRVIGGRMVGASPADLDPRIQAMDEAGIDRQIFWSNFQPNVVSVSTAVKSARLINNTYNEQKLRYDGRFDGWASVPLPHIDEALAEAARCLDELGFAGIGLGCSVLGKPLDSEEFEPFWAELDRRQAAVFIHAGQVAAGLPGCEDFMLGAALVWPAEIALAGIRLVCTGVTERHPNIRFILASGGGLIPGFGGTVDYLHEKIGIPQKTKQSLRQGLAKLFYDTSVRGATHHLEQLKELCGEDNILFGSDTPLGSMKQSSIMIEGCFGPRITNKIISENAAAILRNSSCSCGSHRSAAEHNAAHDKA